MDEVTGSSETPMLHLNVIFSLDFSIEPKIPPPVIAVLSKEQGDTSQNIPLRHALNTNQTLAVELSCCILGMCFCWNRENHVLEFLSAERNTLTITGAAGSNQRMLSRNGTL